MSKLTVVVFAVLVSSYAHAGKPAPIRLDWLVRESAQITVARVASADTLPSEGCAAGDIRFVLEALEHLKGRSESSTLCSPQHLQANSTYVFFLANPKVARSRKPQVLRAEAALLVTESALDTASRWVEIDTVAGIAPGGVPVRHEQTKKCASDSTNCEIVRARELIRFSDLLELVKAAGEN